MEEVITCPLAVELGRQLRHNHLLLTRRWLDRISARVTLEPNRVFPSDDLLDHIPILMDGIADYLENPADEIGADVPVIAKAMELGALRHSQGFAVTEILKEYEILGGVLFSFLVEVVEGLEDAGTPSELLACTKRLFRSISVIEQVTTTQYLAIAQEQVREREDRLRSFNRMVTHELKNSIAAIGGASEILEEGWIANNAEQRLRFTGIIRRNARRMGEVLEDLLSLSRSDESARQQRHLLLPAAAAEACRQLREMAEQRQVEIRLASDIPDIEVDAAAVELCLVNYISNGIKYADEKKAQRWVSVCAYLSEEDVGEEGEFDSEVIVEVADNGVGVPLEARDHLFERFFRADLASDQEGTGLGLSIVQETVARVGGRAWVEFIEGGEGTTFKIALPARRVTDKLPPDVEPGMESSTGS